MPRVAWKSFTEARAVARGLGLTGGPKWKEWSKSGQRPSDIPGDPFTVYRDDGWISWPDWLGSERRVLAKDMLPFTEGRAYVQKLKLRSKKEWVAWRKSGQRPSNIPSSPDKTYRDDGWISWPDWLGSERVAWRSFTEARALARGLELKGAKEWAEWSKSGHRPSDIPADPATYRDDGWISWPDSERVAWKSFTEGREYVRGLELESQRGWHAWNKSKHRPPDIPAHPEKTYRDDGWISYPDCSAMGSNTTCSPSRRGGRTHTPGS
jgi:hypothetical protein